jgi:hypothetical protein
MEAQPAEEQPAGVPRMEAHLRAVHPMVAQLAEASELELGQRHGSAERLSRR